MKITALILGLLGALLVAVLGLIWVDDYKKNEEIAKSADEMAQLIAGTSEGEDFVKLTNKLKKRVTAGYLMLGLGPLALIASGFVFKVPRASGGVMAAAGIVPAFWAPESLLFGLFLLLAALFAFLARPRRAVEA